MFYILVSRGKGTDRGGIQLTRPLLDINIYLEEIAYIFCLPLAKEPVSQFPLPLVGNRTKLVWLTLLNDFLNLKIR